MIRKFGEWEPKISKDAIIHDSALIMGNVVIGRTYIFPHVLIRADEHVAMIEDDVAILDKAFIEADRDVLIEKGSVISHAAIIHGGKIGENVLVGIGAIVLDAKIGKNSIVASGSLVKDDFDENSFIAGIPAKKIRSIEAKDIKYMEEIKNEIRRKVEWLRK